MILWDHIDTVLLDMDGTLLDLAFDNFFWREYVPRAYGERHGLNELEARVHLERWIDSHQGTLNWYCLDFWGHELKLPIMAMKREVADRIAWRPGAERFLQQVRASGRRLILTTNAHRDSLALKIERTGLDRHFHGLVSSHDYGHAKEEPGFWTALQQQWPFDPARTLMVDDALNVLVAARTYGVAHLLSIRHPDSREAPRADTAPFVAIDHFDQVLPPDGTGHD